MADCLVSGDDTEILVVIGKALQKREPLEIINKGLIPAMKEMGRLYDEGIIFLPQIILSSDAMVAGISLCEEKMGQSIEKKARVVTHTAEGDIHDIGQVIVNALLNAAGFEVINLGADVPVDDVVEACRLYKPIMLSGTALMTTTMTAFPRIAQKMVEQGIIIPFVCGGGAVSEAFVTGYDLGIWGKEAGWAPLIAEDILFGMDWKEIRTKWNR
ncbi:MAG: cobalamin-dependent protein [Methanospirillaceae archaeon]|nr:cobalamin-dependent protein [Methanospirillaceae archaeon]